MMKTIRVLCCCGIRELSSNRDWRLPFSEAAAAGYAVAAMRRRGWLCSAGDCKDVQELVLSREDALPNRYLYGS